MLSSGSGVEFVSIFFVVAPSVIHDAFVVSFSPLFFFSYPQFPVSLLFFSPLLLLCVE